MTGERAAALRDEAVRVLAPLADLAAPVAPGADAPWDQLVRVNEHQVREAASCLARAAFDSDFDGWRAAFARKRIGRSVLERMRKGASLDPSTLAREVVVDAAEHGRDGLSQWLGLLGPGGMAAVVRDATTWATTARAEMRTWPPPADTKFDNPPAIYRWQLPGRAVQLEATADGVVRGAGALLLLTTAAVDNAGAQRELAWLAFVATVATGRLPTSVTRIDLASGARRRVPVTDDVLDDGLTAAARAVEAAMAARYTAPATPTPGRWCRSCAGRTVCEPGAAWLHDLRATTPHAP
jgi:hypothetical protein